ncbi:MAG: hypothetical protein FJX78_11105 [Armatimonadetes bacterium]|nr:hypothetical protein [Armatimonadota bacterium]
MQSTATETARSPLSRGIIGGLVGGLVMTVPMAMMEALPVVGSLVGQPNAIVGFLFHMVISAVIGAGFTYTLANRVTATGSGITWGLIYGAIWSVLGPLLIMPTWMGMGPQLTGAGISAAIPSLGGHLLFGGALGYGYNMLGGRTSR